MLTNGNGTNGLSKKRELTCQKIIEALCECNGLLTLAARKAGVSYTTVKRYALEMPSVRQAVNDAKESMLDFAEGKLYQKIKAGDNTAIIFYLKTQGKGRGYIERQEFTGEGGKPIEVSVDYRNKLLSAVSRFATASSEGKGDKTP